MERKRDIIYGALGITYFKEEERICFLLVKHKDGFWTFPAGAAEDEDSSLRETIKREIKDEVGVESDKYIFVNGEYKNEFVYGKEKPNREGKKGITVIYLIKFKEKDTIKPRNEIIQAKWVDKEEVLKKIDNEDIKEIFLDSLKSLE